MSETTVLQTVWDAVATKLDEIDGLAVYKSFPERGAAMPAAVLYLIYAGMHGGYPDTRQFVDVLVQVTVWGFTPASRDQYADKVIDKVYRSRADFGFVDIKLQGARDLPPEQEHWQRVLEFKVTTLVTKA